MKIFIFHKRRRQSTFICLVFSASQYTQKIVDLLIISSSDLDKKCNGPRWSVLCNTVLQWASKPLVKSISLTQQKKNSLLCASSRHGLKLWMSPKLNSFLWNLQVSRFPWFAFSFSSEAHPFLRQKRVHPRKLLLSSLRAGKTHSFSPHYDLPLNSFTPADHHAANHPSRQKRPNGWKQTKCENLWGKWRSVSV